MVFRVSGLLLIADWSKEYDCPVCPNVGCPLKEEWECNLSNDWVNDLYTTKWKTYNIIWNIHYLALLSFFSADLFIDPVKTDGTVVAPKEICLRSSRTDGSGFLSMALRLRTSPSYKSWKHFSKRRPKICKLYSIALCALIGNWIYPMYH